MTPFLHDRLQRFERLLAMSNSALSEYTAIAPDLHEVIVAFLDEAGTVYKALGLASSENEIRALLAEYTSARAGVHPVTLERVTQRRREMERAIALRILLASAEVVRRDHAQVRERLAAATERLYPILAYAARTGLLPLLGEWELNEAGLTKLWQSLIADQETGQAARQAACGVHQADVLLLVANLLGGVNQ